MIDMTSRTDYIAISPSCIKFSVSFRPQSAASWLRLAVFVFTHYESLRIIGLVGVRKNPFFLTKIS